MSAQILQLATEFALYTGYLTFSLGIIGNIINVIVFTQFKHFRNNPCVFYLTVESISSFFYQIMAVSLTILTSIYGDDATGRSSAWCKFRYVYAQAFGLTTFYTISFAAIDQFLSTHYLFTLRKMSAMKVARRVTFIFVCFIIAHAIAFGLSFDSQPLTGCVISQPIWLQYATYFFYPFLAGLIPITSACFFGILAYRNVRRIVRRQIPIVRRRLDRQMTAMVLIRVIIFVCLASPNTFYRIYANNFPVSKSKPLEYAIGRLIQALFYFFASLNYTASFYVFVVSSSRFRRQVKLVLVKKCWYRIKFCCGSNPNQIAPDNGTSYGTDMDIEEND